jgi:uncharacterized protein (TIGR02246 family)
MKWHRTGKQPALVYSIDYSENIARSRKNTMLKHTLGILWLLLACGATAEPADDITRVLQEQEAAWNRGDLDAYMLGYWQDDRLSFISNGKIRYGWDKTLAAYRHHYPSRAAMGQLHFSFIDIKLLGDNAALVTGRWQLVREKDRPSGIFSLIFEKMADRWIIIHDHSSD